MNCSPDKIHLSTGEQFMFYLFDVPVNLARLAAWYLREAYLDQTGRSVPSYRIVTETEAVKAGA